MTLVVLVALLVAGLAHASRLCGIDRHATTPAAGAVRCPAHHAAHVAPATDDARSRASSPAESPPHERTPSCCASGVSLATLPGARADLARDASLATPAPVLVDARPSVDETVRAVYVVRAVRDPGSGPRRHLVQRILLI
jgi:hypothetical protein